MPVMPHCSLDWGVAARPLPGEEFSGDHHLVVRTSTGWLLAVADGLGHGPEAAVAGMALIEVLKAQSEQAPADLIHLCHEALKTTRGCAAVIAAIDQHQQLLSWVGVGNVEGVLRRSGQTGPCSHYITMRGGIIGYRLPPLVEATTLHLVDDDLLILATDGIDSTFTQIALPVLPPGHLAGYLLHSFAKPADDALVLVGRWHAPPTRPEREFAS